jgi:hypothetical protein
MIGTQDTNKIYIFFIFLDGYQLVDRKIKTKLWLVGRAGQHKSMGSIIAKMKCS